MSRYGIVLIAASTPRSLKYLTALHDAKVTVDEVYVLDDGAYLPGQREEDSSGAMASRIVKFCNENGINTSAHPSNVNSESLVTALQRSDTKLAIYSGYGGQIVKKDVLDAGKSILHIHSGVLPDYRGSTTIYYAILNGDVCGATAILLDRNIDTGVIVGEKTFSTPAPGSDVDFQHDIEFRTELLVDIVSYYKDHGAFRAETRQSLEEGKSYYVAHPVLRHIAMLREV